MLEITIILLTLLLNAFFALSEIGLVSASRAKLKTLAEDGDPSAARALKLLEHPSGFLSTVQIGITFAGLVGAIFGGAALGHRLAGVFTESSSPVVSGHAEALAQGLVSFVIGTLTIIFAELVPKRLAMLFPETVARIVAAPMAMASCVAMPAVKVFSTAADGILRLFGLRRTEASRVSEDEVRMLIDQGLESGVLHSGEHDMMQGVLALDKLTAGGLMTPRSRVIWLNVNDTDEANWRKVAGSGHTHFPVHDGNPDRVLGVVSLKSMWANLALAGRAEIRHLVTPALTTPMATTGTRLLETFKHDRRHMALVTDEFGSMRGLVTLNDVLESIVGDIPTELKAAGSEANRRDDGTWIVDGLIEIGDLKDLLSLRELPGEDRGAYHTLAGLLLFMLGHIPRTGEKVEYAGFVFEIAELDCQRIDKVIVREKR